MVLQGLVCVARAGRGEFERHCLCCSPIICKAYDRVVLDTPLPDMQHVSYPSVWEWNGDVYMLPESKHVNEIRLFVADPFPHHWSVAVSLLHLFRPHFQAFQELAFCIGASTYCQRIDQSIVMFLQEVIAEVSGGFAGPSIVRHPVSGFWFLFVTTADNSQLLLLFAQTLHGAWRQHPGNPIVSGDHRRTRCGGRIVVTRSGRIFRPVQDMEPVDGLSCIFCDVTSVSPTHGNGIAFAHALPSRMCCSRSCSAALPCGRCLLSGIQDAGSASSRSRS